MMILPFKKVAALGWRPDELAECYRVVDLLLRAGLPVSIQTGVSDEGEPWGVVVRDDTGDMLIHLARTDGQFLVASAAGTPVQRGRNLRDVINLAFSQGDLALASQRAQLFEGDVIRLHPSALMAAVIVTAWLHTEVGRDTAVASRTDRSEVVGGSTGAVRLGSDAAPPPHLTVLMKAAVSFAAVVAALETSSKDWMPLELDIDALVTLAAAPRLLLNGSSLLSGGMETDAGTTALLNFDALEAIMADGAAHAPSSSENWAEASSVGTSLPIILTAASHTFADVVSSTSYATGAAASWSPSGLDLPSLNLPFADGNVTFTLPNADDGEAFMGALPLGALAPSLNRPEPQNSASTLLIAAAPSAAPVSQASTAVASIPPVGTANPERQTAFVEASVQQAETRSENSTLPDTQPLSGLETSPFFRSALQFLHFDQSFQKNTQSFGAGSLLPINKFTTSSNIYTEENSKASENPNTSLEINGNPSLSVHPFSNTAIADNITSLAPALALTSIQPNAAVTGAVLSTDLPSAPDFDQPTTPPARPTAAVSTTAVTTPEPPVPNNTEILLNFAGDAANATKASAAAWSAIAAAEQDTAGASRVLVFDASWLSGKAFMLMPGMAMVENDLLAGTARVSLPPSAPVTLELGDGLSVQLLGVLTV